MFGALTDQIGRCFGELMEELRAIREEIALLRTAIEDTKPHPALRPVNKKAAAARGK